MPFISYDFTELSGVVSDSIVAKIKDINAEWGNSRARCWGERGERITHEDLLAVIADLEAQVIQFCGS